MNKGNLKHPGGYVHAGINGLGTMMTLAITLQAVGFGAIVCLGIMDFATHHAIDYAKVDINKKMGWRPETSPEYWYSLGIDQTLHWFVYMLIMFMALAMSNDNFGGLFVLVILVSFLGTLMVRAIVE